ncbi:aminotransferase class I/II-fold pyridoxal phosphate-dependent enzyme [bacterium]|nr:aminotransferase class I/II-fold pyridoxal phosphate-dependent enzyme [bacterium]
MPTDRIKAALLSELEELEQRGVRKAPERVVVGYLPAREGRGPRFLLAGQGDKPFLKMNSNGYLGLAQDPRLIEAEDTASRELGVNPGAVRFIDGTTKYHQRLEERLAAFHGCEAAKIFSCAYMANLGVAIALCNKSTYVISDELNHNSIVRALRIAGVPGENKGIFKHNDVADLERCLDAVPAGIQRVIVIFDGVFSMRGDYAPLREIVAACKMRHRRFRDGVLTIVDDSHGTAAYGPTGRGTPEVAGESDVDVITSTLGKAFGAEGGYVAGTAEIIEIVRQRADTYIYTNPVSPGAANAGLASLAIVDSDEGRGKIAAVKANAEYFRSGIETLGFETIPGVHPIVPVLIRDTARVRAMVKALFEHGILATGLTFPVVPVGDETIRIQLSAAHTRADLDYVLETFGRIK